MIFGGTQNSCPLAPGAPAFTLPNLLPLPNSYSWNSITARFKLQLRNVMNLIDIRSSSQTQRGQMQTHGASTVSVAWDRITDELKKSARELGKTQISLTVVNENAAPITGVSRFLFLRSRADFAGQRSSAALAMSRTHSMLIADQARLSMGAAEKFQHQSHATRKALDTAKQTSASSLSNNHSKPV